MSEKESLIETAKAFESKPANAGKMLSFLERLAREDSVVEIEKLLPLDYEQITGHALRRLAELIFDDPDLYLSVALWYYHFGLDDEALKWLEKARQMEPFGLAVLQTEIYLNYGQDPDLMLVLSLSALSLHPDDKWLLAVKNTIEGSGNLDKLVGPPLNSKWHKRLANETK